MNPPHFIADPLVLRFLRADPRTVLKQPRSLADEEFSS
jgi:hypothetical protein